MEVPGPSDPCVLLYFVEKVLGFKVGQLFCLFPTNHWPICNEKYITMPRSIKASPMLPKDTLLKVFYFLDNLIAMLSGKSLTEGHKSLMSALIKSAL